MSYCRVVHIQGEFPTHQLFQKSLAKFLQVIEPAFPLVPPEVRPSVCEAGDTLQACSLARAVQCLYLQDGAIHSDPQKLIGSNVLSFSLL